MIKTWEEFRAAFKKAMEERPVEWYTTRTGAIRKEGYESNPSCYCPVAFVNNAPHALGGVVMGYLAGKIMDAADEPDNPMHNELLELCGLNS